MKATRIPPAPALWTVSPAGAPARAILRMAFSESTRSGPFADLPFCFAMSGTLVAATSPLWL